MKTCSKKFANILIGVICSLLLGKISSAQGYQSVDLGPALKLKKDRYGDGYDLKVYFSYDAGLIGDRFQTMWGAMFPADLSKEEFQKLPPLVKWNIFNFRAGRYLEPWSRRRKFSRDYMRSVYVDTDGEFAKQIMGIQSHMALVFADENGRPLYHVDLGELCLSSPQYFYNITETEVACHQISVEEIDRRRAQFCVDREKNLQRYVEEGVLTCKQAKESYARADCGKSLQCQ